MVCHPSLWCVCASSCCSKSRKSDYQLWGKTSGFCAVLFCVCKTGNSPLSPSSSDSALASPALVSGSFYRNCCKVPSYLNWLLWSCIWGNNPLQEHKPRGSKLLISHWFPCSWPANPWFPTWPLPVTKFTRAGSKSWIMWGCLVREIRFH